MYFANNAPGKLVGWLADGLSKVRRDFMVGKLADCALMEKVGVWVFHGCIVQDGWLVS